MPEMSILGVRVPQDWHQQIQAIAQASGRKESQVVREAIAEYLGKSDPNSVKSAIADLQTGCLVLSGD